MDTVTLNTITAHYQDQGKLTTLLMGLLQEIKRYYDKDLLISPEYTVNGFIVDHSSEIATLTKNERSKKIDVTFIQKTIAVKKLNEFVITACTLFLQEVAKLTIVQEVPQKEGKKTLRDIFTGLEFYDNIGRRDVYEPGPSSYALATY